jgi:hypothetical protein
MTAELILQSENSRISAKDKTAPAKFEEDLAPTTHHSRGKDLSKLLGCVARRLPDRKLLVDCCHPNYEGTRRSFPQRRHMYVWTQFR